MATDSEILKKGSTHVHELLSTRLPAWAVYHSSAHTDEVVAACRDIAEATKLSKADMEAALLAAWFHDTGYTETADGHEERSVKFAEDFLRSQAYPAERIEAVKRAIRSTRLPQHPETPLEEVVCDADLSHIGRKGFSQKNELMRLEFESWNGKAYSRREWLNMNIEFIAKHRFHTEYARREYRKRRQKNLARLQEEYREAVVAEQQQAAKLELKKAGKSLKEKIPERGIETMFRTVPKNHLDLSSMADQKANIMLSTSSIIITIVVSVLLRKLDENPILVIPTLILITVCLLTIVFAILATRPKVTSGTFTHEDIEQKRVNLLFFGNFHKASLDDFEWGMREMMNDREYLYGSMIKDLYFLGQVLGRKYHYLRICYNIFMYGMIVAVAAYLIAFITAPPLI
jgi:predicted metal-dependent HD superfamily phosphohydrolase